MFAAPSTASVARRKISVGAKRSLRPPAALQRRAPTSESSDTTKDGTINDPATVSCAFSDLSSPKKERERQTEEKPTNHL